MRKLLLLTTLLLSLALAAPATAGNWAVTTADQPSSPPVVDSATTLGFTILQHGRTPAPWVTATLVLVEPVTGARMEVPMRADGADGHFLADVTFPDAGEWTWAVELAELGSDSTGSLIVLRANSAAAGLEPGLAALEQRFAAALERVAELEQRLAALEDATAAAAR